MMINKKKTKKEVLKKLAIQFALFLTLTFILFDINARNFLQEITLNITHSRAIFNIICFSILVTMFVLFCCVLSKSFFFCGVKDEARRFIWSLTITSFIVVFFWFREGRRERAELTAGSVIIPAVIYDKTFHYRSGTTIWISFKNLEGDTSGTFFDLPKGNSSQLTVGDTILIHHAKSSNATKLDELKPTPLEIHKAKTNLENYLEKKNNTVDTKHTP